MIADRWGCVRVRRPEREKRLPLSRSPPGIEVNDEEVLFVKLRWDLHLRVLLEVARVADVNRVPRPHNRSGECIAAVEQHNPRPLPWLEISHVGNGRRELGGCLPSLSSWLSRPCFRNKGDPLCCPG
jgi:hypothetical protein